MFIITNTTETLTNNARIKNKLTQIVYGEIKETKTFEIAKDEIANVVGVYLMLYKGKVMYLGYSERLGSRLKEQWSKSHKPEILKNKKI